MSALVKGFGRRPMTTVPQASGPSSESLQGRKPRWGIRVCVPEALWGIWVRCVIGSTSPFQERPFQGPSATNATTTLASWH